MNQKQVFAALTWMGGSEAVHFQEALMTLTGGADAQGYANNEFKLLCDAAGYNPIERAAVTHVIKNGDDPATTLDKMQKQITQKGKYPDRWFGAPSVADLSACIAAWTSAGFALGTPLKLF